MHYKIREKILLKAIPLEKYGLNDLAWYKEDAKSLIHSIMEDEIGILGGDVYKLSPHRLEPTYESWFCKEKETESKQNYYLRSKAESLSYIENHSKKPENEIIFSITFTAIIEPMSALNAHDLKQIRTIEKKITLFENEKIELLDFLCDLTELLDGLESTEDSWKEAFQDELNALEVIYSDIENGSISKRKEDLKENVHESILKLKKMSEFILNQYLIFSDLNISESASVADVNWFTCPKCNNAWKSNSMTAMVVCPKCERAFHNARASQV